MEERIGSRYYRKFASLALAGMDAPDWVTKHPI